jgi:CBS domain-containing protein
MNKISENLSSSVKQILLKDVMHTPPIILNVDEEFAKVEKTLREHRIKHLPIVNDSDKLVGIITLSDLYRTCAPRRRAEDGSFFYTEDQLNQFILGVVMTKNPKSLKANHTLYDAMKLMASSGCGCVPVVDANGKMEGIITQTDVVKHVTDLLGD